jgi:hypothetical protein
MTEDEKKALIRRLGLPKDSLAYRAYRGYQRAKKLERLMPDPGWVNAYVMVVKASERYPAKFTRSKGAPRTYGRESCTLTDGGSCRLSEVDSLSSTEANRLTSNATNFRQY